MSIYLHGTIEWNGMYIKSLVVYKVDSVIPTYLTYLPDHQILLRDAAGKVKTCKGNVAVSKIGENQNVVCVCGNIRYCLLEIFPLYAFLSFVHIDVSHKKTEKGLLISEHHHHPFLDPFAIHA